MKHILSKAKRTLGQNLRALMCISIAGLVLTVLVLSQSGLRSNVYLQETVALENIQDNRLGGITVHRDSPVPAYYRPPGMEACIYTSGQEAPLITDVRSRDRLLTSSIEEVSLNLTIPKEKLDKDSLQQSYNLTMSERCPLRSSPKIVLKKK